jgi:hypothetical protein
MHLPAAEETAFTQASATPMVHALVAKLAPMGYGDLVKAYAPISPKPRF